jgi:hypothetical protein
VYRDTTNPKLDAGARSDLITLFSDQVDERSADIAAPQQSYAHNRAHGANATGAPPPPGTYCEPPSAPALNLTRCPDTQAGHPQRRTCDLARCPDTNTSPISPSARPRTLPWHWRTAIATGTD